MYNEKNEIERAVDALMVKMDGRDWSFDARVAAVNIFEPAIEDAFMHLGFKNPDKMAAKATALARSKLNLHH